MGSAAHLGSSPATQGDDVQGTATAFSVLFRAHGQRELQRGHLHELRHAVLSDLDPARKIPNYHGQRHRIGFYASTKVGVHLPYESGLERLRLQFLDFDRGVTTYLTQPFTLEWQAAGKTYHYTPDLLVIRTDGSRVVEDVKPARFHHTARNVRAFEAAREAMSSIGVAFELWAPPAPTVVRNVQYLAGYRRMPAGLREYMRPVLAALREGPHTLDVLSRVAGTPALALPVIYHLIWHHRIGLDLTQPLHLSTRLNWQAAR